MCLLNPEAKGWYFIPFGGSCIKDRTLSANVCDHGRDCDLTPPLQVYRATHRLLLLGAGESGKSTLVKQMRILHVEDPFSAEERAEKKADIRQNVRDAILTIAQAMGNIEPPLAVVRPDSGPSHEFVLRECPSTDFDYTPEFWEHTELLWDDPNVKKCYERSNEYQLIDSAKYFLDKVGDVKKDDYNPSEQDILRSVQRLHKCLF